jgi:NTP pyrophosphatase (non-canonical NTP hydrolase)
VAISVSPTASGDAAVERRLDEWYLTINKIYLGRNFYRSASSLFTHLVETCGGLSRYARADWVPSTADEFVTKALAWWFALCSNVGIRSVEEMLWTKFPNVCSYCLRRPHDPDRCAFEREHIYATQGSLAPRWTELSRLADENIRDRPGTIAEYVDMFIAIYGAPDEEFASIFARLNEELGELAEAVRVFPVAPHYFLNEAADVFAWLLRSHCRIAQSHGDVCEGWGQLLGEQLWAAYPDTCKECQADPCVCPPLLRPALGRLAVAGPEYKSHFAAGGMFLPLVDMLEAIEKGAGKVRVGEREYIVYPRDFEEFASDVERLRTRIDEIATTHRASLAQILSGLEEIAVSEAINETRLLDLTAEVVSFGTLLSEEPGDVQTEVRAFINGLASNLVAALLLAVGKGVGG